MLKLARCSRPHRLYLPRDGFFLLAANARARTWALAVWRERALARLNIEGAAQTVHGASGEDPPTGPRRSPRPKVATEGAKG